MAELSSAEDFQQHLADFCRVNSPWGQALYMVRAAIEARDKAVALRAKLEALDDLVPLLAFTGRNRAILDVLRAKYQEKP